jgi:hypothetical protein
MKMEQAPIWTFQRTELEPDSSQTLSVCKWTGFSEEPERVPMSSKFL